MVLLQDPKPNGELESNGILLVTRRGTHIPNQQGKNIQPYLYKLVVETYKDLKLAQPLIADSTYNCTGMVLASRRTQILVKHVQWILEEDGYVRLPKDEQPSLGDVVIYGDGHDPDDLTHVGIIWRIERDPQTGLLDRKIVLSKWGSQGPEYIHPIDHVPKEYGRPVEYWRHSGHL